MARQYPALTDAHRAFIARQRVFLVASAAAGTRVNVSPRSTDCLAVLGPNAVAYLDRTGSGNETAAHLRADGRITLMLCAFDGPPLIMRLYGQGRVAHRDTEQFRALLRDAFADDAPLGTRQIVTVAVDLVQTSCGFGVPLFEYQGERPTMDDWAEAKGPAGIEAYWREKNRRSMDGLPTGLLDEPVA